MNASRPLAMLVAAALGAVFGPGAARAATTSPPNDPDLALQTDMALVDAAGAWATTTGSPGVVVAVLDTAVDLDHPDLAGKLVSPASFVPANSCLPGTTAVNHGTVVAGIVAAATDNGVGGAGLGWDTRVMPVAVLCPNGEAAQATVAQGIRYAVDHGAGILNLSFAQAQVDTVLVEAVAYARNKGVIVVASAGNGGTTVEQYPAALPDVISVGASDASGALASFSNRGPWVDLIAPGTNGYGPVRGGGGRAGWQGTSFATPLVSATAALIVASQPGITLTGVVGRLQRGALPIQGASGSVAWGRLSAGRSVGAPTAGYWLVQANGAVTSLGDAGGYGNAPGVAAVAIVPTPTSRGYWVVGHNGAIVARGDALVLGSPAGALVPAPIAAASATPSGKGLWLITETGLVFPFGDAPAMASLNPAFLPAPIVSAARTPSGRGLWLAGGDGSVYTLGDAPALGSLTGVALNRPVVSISATPSGKGYWMSASDGGVFAYGDAGFYGSTGNIVLNEPIVGLVPTPSGRGYQFVARDGGVFSYGDAPFVGSGVGRVTSSVVGLAR